MPIVTFLPYEKAIDVLPGTELLDAARQADVEIESPCGGKGVCGRCALRVVSGDVLFDSSGVLPVNAVDDSVVLACKTQVLDSPVTIDVPEQIGPGDGQFVDPLDDMDFIGHDRFPSEREEDLPAAKCFLDVSVPRLGDGLSDLDRLTRRLQQDWGKKEIVYPLPVLRSVADALRADGGNVTVTLIRETDRLHVIDVEPGNRTDRHYGIAVDVGTTTLALQLVSLTQARVMTTRSDYNDQVSCGLDVISRIHYARRPDRREELRDRVLHTINRLVCQICESHGVKPEEIRHAAISGNTTMMHLLLGLNPEYIRLEPYTPTVLEVPYLTAAEIGIEIHPQAGVYLSPSVGSYVGGDITAGVLCTDLAKDREEISLFIDIGTNGELVVGNRDFLMTCACSAGPAFEGGGIGCGMRAALGAVDRVEVDPETGIAGYSTIGNVRPQGICGSGMISLLADLFLTGWIDSAGKLDRSRTSPSIRVDGRQASYTIVPADETNTQDPLAVSELDIENLMRAKAAIYSACALMLEQVGIEVEDLAKVYIAGGFGRFLDLEKAIIIGLVPDLPREKFQYIGNASLRGTSRVLVSREYRKRQSELARRMTYIDLSTDLLYMGQYTGALFLPHTDLDRFPSVKAAMKREG